MELKSSDIKEKVKEEEYLVASHVPEQVRNMAGNLGEIGKKYCT